MSKDGRKKWYKNLSKIKHKILARNMSTNGSALEEEDIIDRKDASISTFFH